jgi:hypothetical protein
MANNRKERMEELQAKLNLALSDEEMANATGGAEGEQPDPKFQVGDRFKVDPYVIEGEVTGIHGYYGSYSGWVYDCHVRDDEGWYDSIEYEFNMDPI